jgi:hypothetical protein
MSSIKVEVGQRIYEEMRSCRMENVSHEHNHN